MIGCDRDFELKIVKDGKRDIVTWSGKDGLNACERYADCNKGVAVIAWREKHYTINPVNPKTVHILQ